MSLAWRLLQEAIEDGQIIVDTKDVNKDEIHDIEKLFSKPLALIPAEDSREIKEESIDMDFEVNSLSHDNIDDTETVSDSFGTSSPAVPLHEEQLNEYLDDASRKLAAAKAYRKALLSGKTKNNVSVKSQKRQCRIYRDIVMEKLSPKFAIPAASFKELVDEVMENDFPDYQIDEEALVALQRESELMATKMMCLAGHLANHASRETVRVKDIEFLKFLFYKNREGCYFDPGC